MHLISRSLLSRLGTKNLRGSKVFWNCFFIALSLVALPLHGEWANPKEGGPVHEAFVIKTGGSIFLQAVNQEPPQPINERIPEQKDPNTQWIRGYWDFDENTKDYIWVCGVWRRVPPQMKWIEGYWSKEAEGWVRVRGLWSSQPEEQLSYLSNPPPDSLNEDAGKRPSDQMFWVSGYWQWDPSRRAYQWLLGKWAQLDKDWVLVPAHYVFRPKGYLLVPAFWDYPIDNRGTAFGCLDIPPNARADYIYTPSNIIAPNVIIERCFCCYPDYLYLFYHHWCYHPDYWISFPWTPPWWGWDAWWCFPWHNHWGVWWWWCHPGFPQPLWLTTNYARQIGAPPQDLLNRLRGMIGPAIVTPRGVLSPSALLDTLKSPIVPLDLNLGDLLTIPDPIILPSGSDDSLRQNMDDQLPLPPDSITQPSQRPGQQVLPELPRSPEVTLPSRPILPPSDRPSVTPTPPTPPFRPVPPRQVEPQRPDYRPRPERPDRPRPEWPDRPRPQWPDGQRPEWPDRPRPQWPDNKPTHPPQTPPPSNRPPTQPPSRLPTPPYQPPTFPPSEIRPSSPSPGNRPLPTIPRQFGPSQRQNIYKN